MQMLEDIGHPYARGEPVYDVTFENVQAGLRTDYLFRLANQRNAFVLGTGDLSELALGWCTYGVGDHMSHYNVNGSLAKTLIQYLDALGRAKRAVRRRDGARDRCPILDTEISPELVPADAQGDDAEHAVEGRAVRAAGLPPVLHHALRAAPVEGRVPRVACVARRGARRRGRRQFPDAAKHAYDLADDPQVAARVPRALLRDEPVQALGAAEQPQGRVRRQPVAARRLARAVGRQRERLARGARREVPSPLAKPCSLPPRGRSQSLGAALRD